MSAIVRRSEVLERRWSIAAGAPIGAITGEIGLGARSAARYEVICGPAAGRRDRSLDPEGRG